MDWMVLMFYCTLISQKTSPVVFKSRFKVHTGASPRYLFSQSQRRRSRDASTDLTDHTKTTILVYLEYLLNIDAVHDSNILLWSDGPSSQFKNRFMAKFMEMSEEKHASNIKWNFFATSHGKGAVDGVGGVLKRRVWNKVKARQVVIQNAAEFTDAVKDGGIICNFLTEYLREVTIVRGLEYCVEYCLNDASIWVRLPVASRSKR